MNWERWFDGDYSECYYGEGHQDKAEFAAWATEEDGGQSEPYTADDVEHLWMQPIDDERFKIVDATEPGLHVAITCLDPLSPYRKQATR